MYKVMKTKEEKAGHTNFFYDANIVCSRLYSTEGGLCPLQVISCSGLNGGPQKMCPCLNPWNL